MCCLRSELLRNAEAYDGWAKSCNKPGCTADVIETGKLLAAKAQVFRKCAPKCGRGVRQVEVQFELIHGYEGGSKGHTKYTEEVTYGLSCESSLSEDITNDVRKHITKAWQIKMEAGFKGTLLSAGIDGGGSGESSTTKSRNVRSSGMSAYTQRRAYKQTKEVFIDISKGCYIYQEYAHVRMWNGPAITVRGALRQFPKML